MMERLAPKTAALDTPKVDGEAIGLSRLVCMIRPDTDSPSPAMTAARTLGMRICQMIRMPALVPCPKSTETHSVRDIREEPVNRQTNPKTATDTVRAVIIRSFCCS